MDTEREYTFTVDYYIDLLNRIAQIWRSKGSPVGQDDPDGKWREHIIMAMSHIDLLICYKAIGRGIAGPCEISVLAYLINHVKPKRLARMNVDPDKLRLRQTSLASRYANADSVEAINVDQNPFLPVLDYKGVDENHFVAGMISRMQTMLHAGFSHFIILKCAHYYREFAFDRYKNPDGHPLLAGEPGDRMAFVLPGMFAAIAIMDGYPGDIVTVLAIADAKFVPAVLNKSDAKIWTTVAGLIMDRLQRTLPPKQEEDKTIRKGVVKSVTHLLAMFIDQTALRQASLLEEEMSSLSLSKHWTHLDDADVYIHPGMGNTTDSIRTQVRRYVYRRLDYFEARMCDKPGCGPEVLGDIRKGIDEIIAARDTSGNWDLCNAKLYEMLHYMWEIVHLSGTPLVYGTQAQALEYLEEVARFAHEVKRVAETQDISLEYGANVEGTFDDHVAGLEAACTLFKTREVRIAERCKLAEGLRGRVRLVAEIYLRTRGETWSGETWKAVNTKLVDISRNCIYPSSPYNTVCNVHPWFWMAKAVIHISVALSISMPIRDPRMREFLCSEVEKTILPTLCAEKDGKRLLRMINDVYHIMK